MYYESYARYIGVAPSATAEYPHWMILEAQDKNILRMTPYSTLQWRQEIVHSIQFLTKEDALLFKLAFS